MRLRALCIVTVTSALLAATATVESAAPASGAVVRKFEGSVVSVKRSNRSFLLHDLRRGGNFRIYVRSGTRYAKGLKGYQSLRKELEIEVRAVRSEGGRLLARKVELD